MGEISHLSRCSESSADVNVTRYQCGLSNRILWHICDTSDSFAKHCNTDVSDLLWNNWIAVVLFRLIGHVICTRMLYYNLVQELDLMRSHWQKWGMIVNLWYCWFIADIIRDDYEVRSDGHQGRTTLVALGQRCAAEVRFGPEFGEPKTWPKFSSLNLANWGPNLPVTGLYVQSRFRTRSRQFEPEEFLKTVHCHQTVHL